jgi:hypothetical protein
MVIRPNTYFTITQLVKNTRVWASNKVRKANDSGLLGEIVNVAGMHSLRRTAVIEIFENKQDLRLAQTFWDIKHTNYFQLLTR